MDLIRKMRDSPDFARGRQEAEADIARGVLKFRAFGKLVSWWEEAARLLMERYRIGYEVVAWCLVPPGVMESTCGYNERMEQEVRLRVGEGVVGRLWREAEHAYRTKWGGS